MQVWSRYNTGLALIAALCFAVLSGLHAARPVSAEVVFSVYGYAAGDICGLGEEAASGDCPNCTLSAGAVALASVELQHWQVVATELVLPFWGDVQNCGRAIDPYQARGPPLFT